jgi:hypothetical protein
MKYTIDYISGVATRIGIEIPGRFGKYTSGVLEPFFPSDKELLNWSRKEVREWTKKNNKMLKAVCKFLNENKL